MTTSTKQTIRRAKHGKKNPYFMMHQDTAQDKTLSYEARGLLSYLLSKKDDWEVRIPDLILEAQGDKPTKAGKSKVYGILSELAEFRYIKKPKRFKGKGGKWEWTPYEVYERPYPDLPDMDEPDTDEPDTGEPDTANRDSKQNTESPNNDKDNKDNKEQTTTPDPVEQTVEEPNPPPNADKGSGSSPESDDSKTEKTEVTKAEVHTAYQGNINAEISPIEAEELSDAIGELGPEYVLEAIKIAVEQNRKSLRYIQGIFKNWRKDGKPLLGDDQPKAQQDYSGYATTGDTPPRNPDTPAIPVSQRVDNEYPAFAQKTPREVWEATTSQIAIQDRVNFDNWLKGATLVDFDATTGTFTLATRDQYAKDHCQHSMGRTISRIANAVAGIDVLIEFKTEDELREATPA